MRGRDNVNIPSNQKGFGQNQLNHNTQLSSMDKAIRKEKVNGDGLIHIINDSPSNAEAEKGHPTLGNVVDRKA